MKTAKQIDARLKEIDSAARQLREEEAELRMERAVLVDEVDRAEMKRRGHVTHTWKVTAKWASAAVCPFCLTACASSRQEKEFPNEQNAEYRCGNREAIA